MYHDVERELLPFFLREANIKKHSGHLFVSAKDFQITLNLLEGKLANGMSTRFDEKLSVILHLMGGINEEQYNFLSGLHQFSDDQVAGILIDQNFAKKKDIYYARVYQLRRIAISVFTLQRGKWIFTAGEPEPPLRETFDIPLAGVLVEGARSIDHVSIYAGYWQHSIPILFKEIPLDVEMYFTDAEREFYAAVQDQGRCSCQELIARLNLMPIEFWRRLLVFHLLGIVEFEKGEAAIDPAGEIAALLEFHGKLQESPAGGASLPGLPASVSPAEFENARAGLLARFAPERFGSGATPEIKNIARAVCLRLQGLAPGAWPDAATRPGLAYEEKFATELPVGEEAIVGTGESVELSEMDRIAEPEVPLEAEPLNGAEWIVETEAPIEPEPAIAVKLQVDPEIPVEPPSREFAPVAAPPHLRLTNADHEQAWELLLQAKELYEKHKYSGAIPLLKKAIKLEANQGDFYYLLGICQSKEQLTHNEAEINLKKAVELKSWSADPVYALGVLYHGQGKDKLAERCFQRVKEIAYEHTGASRALVDLRRHRKKR